MGKNKGYSRHLGWKGAGYHPQPKASNQFIADLINSKNPFSIIRLRSESRIFKSYKEQKPILPWYEDMVNGGLYPLSQDTYDSYAGHIEKGLKSCDALVYFKHLRPQYESIKSYIESSPLLHLNVNKPYSFREPWSSQLRGKSVLVIHPFVDTIKSQFEKRDLLFDNKDVLPPFGLTTYKPVQTSGGNLSNHPTWEEALDFMLKEISELYFDIALIGCGCYDIPIATHIKTMMGKQAIIYGGSLQCMFGIKGKRWDNREQGKSFYNKHWVRPSNSEKPIDYKKIEGGCYW
jgi:hypothetical protein